MVRDFRFGTGETLPELRLHYVTLGEPRRDAKGVVRNAVLILHGTGGTGRQFLSKNFAEVLFGPGQLLDARTHYIILPDGIGHGGSSRPSDGLRTKFPRYTYADMVTAQYRLVTEGLKRQSPEAGDGHLDGRHAHVDVGRDLPGLHGRPGAARQRADADRRAEPDVAEDDPRQHPERPGVERRQLHAQPPGLEGAVRILVLMAGSTVQAQKDAPDRDKADALLVQQMQSRGNGVDANNMLYYFDASRDYDPSAGLEQITAPLLAINSADDLINPPELGLMETADAARRERPLRAAADHAGDARPRHALVAGPVAGAFPRVAERREER